MNLEEYVVAIPSYKRPETLRTKTLKVLQDYNIDPTRIYIFVADDEQKEIYMNMKYYLQCSFSCELIVKVTMFEGNVI